MHLAAGADARHLGGIKAPEQLRDALNTGSPPVSRVLLRPAGMGKIQIVLSGNFAEDGTAVVHQQQLGGGGTQVDSDVQH